MKKWFKTFVVALLVVPALLSFAGCGKKPAKPDPNEENYKVVRDVTKQAQEYSGSYTQTLNYHDYSEVVREDAQALTDAEKEQFELFDESQRQVVSFSKENRIGYDAQYDFNATDSIYSLTNGRFVVKEDDKYVEYQLYQDDELQTTGTYVDANYAASIFDFKSALQEGVEMGIIGTDAILRYETYKDLTDKYLDELELPEGITLGLTFKISKSEDNYTLEVSTSFTDPTGDVYGVEGAKVSLTTTLTFTDENVVAMHAAFVQEYVRTLPAIVEEPAEDAEPEQPAEPATVNYIVRTYSVSSATFAYAYDASNVPSEFAEVEKTQKDMVVHFVLDGQDYGTSETHYFGDNFDATELPTRDADSTTVRWYLDEGMTKEFDASTYTYPSQDITLYGRSYARKGYALIVYRMTDQEGNTTTERVRVHLIGLDGLTNIGIENTAEFTYNITSIEGAVEYNLADGTVTVPDQGYVVINYTSTSVA